jgi:hypothetical protein
LGGGSVHGRVAVFLASISGRDTPAPQHSASRKA